MKVTKTKIPGLVIVEPAVHGDHRGYFMETYSTKKFEEMGITTTFVQDNMSFSSAKGTLRGLHFQNNPCAQAKLVYCTRGKVIDVAVDIRKGSPTYKQWVAVELSEENKKQLFIPRGFAHGFLTITDNVEFRYKVDNLYSKEHDAGIYYNDPTINIDWEGLLDGITPILSDKDKNSPLLEDCHHNFTFEQEEHI